MNLAMTLNQLVDYIETKLCRESVFIADEVVDDDDTADTDSYINFPDAIRGRHTKYNARYSTMYVAYVTRDAHGDVYDVRICDFEPKFDDNGQLQSYDYEYLCISELENINLQEIDKMLDHDIALANALLKCREIDAQIKLLQEIEKL